MNRQRTVTIDLTSDAGSPLPCLCRIFPTRPRIAPALFQVLDQAVVGRHEGEGVAIALHDATVSRRHAQIFRDGERGWGIRDLGSKNGLFVDGERVQHAPLTEGTRVRIGHCIFVFRQLSVRDPPALPTGLPFLGTSVALRRVEEACRRAAPSRLSMLLLGPTGSGKEVFARYVHAVSDRTGPFVPVNCAAVSEGLFESAFFGHRRGAFTGATQDFAGFARAATGGTLFLDEVAEMSPEAQAKLLRFLDSGDVVPVGSTTPQRVDVRILAATNQDLESLMNDGRFRPDLFARLAGCQIRIPPLSARPEDVIDIALHHVPQGLSPDAAEALVLHDWPYNVRELHAVLDMARLEAPPGEPLPLASLPEPIRERVLYRSPPARKSGQATGTSGPEPGEERSPTSEELSALYRECNGNVSEMARRMDKDRRQIYRWLERFGIRPRS